MQECEALAIEVLPIFGEPSTAVEPCNGTLHDPAFWQVNKSFGLVGAFNDLRLDAGQDVRQRLLELPPLVAGIGEQRLQKGIPAKEGGQQQDAAIAILNIGGMNDGVQQQAQGIYENMALLALDLLACVIARRINAGPPFSALLTLWLSMMATVGLAWRFSCSRHAT
jgi:hypothetical protein